MATERMPNPATLFPEARAALIAVGDAVMGEGIDARLLALTRLRAGQINGSSTGVADGADLARRHGAAVEQVDTVAVWRQTRWFSEAERAALALTESVTRLADSPDAVPDEVWDIAAKHFDQRELAALLLSIAVANATDRLAVPTRQQAGG
ncbi:alkylhydroperoxidase family enzyme [Allocatelliglobosispora scoriae]|uniref:Alkylhydroperoxidase family enzyme n=1 Tax=Allocatelliglobosispora scoriae TaxID=643052 RepID=A0A841BPX1_9ACTN|nr:carboxymuconolactone decarboxylase family protein [Allocatelliglobosispora scoriae]MBB5870314.1 alkylhydroperoxidase family enzyme [Allocatelliglobosispora scoriae]